MNSELHTMIVKQWVGHL